MISRALPPRCIDDARSFGRVAVLLGGSSAEREISIMTGRAVLAALKRQGVDARAVDTRDDAIGKLLAGGFNRAWIALHGRGGEDGTVKAPSNISESPTPAVACLAPRCPWTSFAARC